MAGRRKGSPQLLRPAASSPSTPWLRGPLREWAESLLSERAIADAGVLRPGPIRAVWRRHLSGERNEQHRLWTALTLQAWLAEYRVT